MMIQIAKSTTVRTIVVSPKPNSAMITGTRAESGALMKVLTQGRSMRSRITDRPIRIPTGTPTRIAMKLPHRKVRSVIDIASQNPSVPTISTSRPRVVESGGIRIVRPSRPTISHSTAHRRSDAMAGMR
jgi:hypothetical protein